MLAKKKLEKQEKEQRPTIVGANVYRTVNNPAAGRNGYAQQQQRNVNQQQRYGNQQQRNGNQQHRSGNQQQRYGNQQQRYDGWWNPRTQQQGVINGQWHQSVMNSYRNSQS